MLNSIYCVLMKTSGKHRDIYEFIVLYAPLKKPIGVIDIRLKVINCIKFYIPENFKQIKVQQEKRLFRTSMLPHLAI